MCVLELGGAFDQLDSAQLKFSAGAGLTADTFLGPIYLGGAVGNGGSFRFYVTFGRRLP